MRVCAQGRPMGSVVTPGRPIIRSDCASRHRSQPRARTDGRAGGLHLHVRPVLETVPEAAGIQPHVFGKARIDPVAVDAIGLRAGGPLGRAIQAPEAVDSFAPLVPAQAGQRIGDMGAVLGADAIEDAGQEVGLCAGQFLDGCGNFLDGARLPPELRLGVRRKRWGRLGEEKGRSAPLCIRPCYRPDIFPASECHNCPTECRAP